MGSIKDLINPEIILPYTKNTLEEFKDDIVLWRKHRCFNTHSDWAYDFIKSEYFEKNNNVSYYDEIFSKLNKQDKYDKWVELSAELSVKLASYEKTIFAPNTPNPKDAIINSLPLHAEIFSLQYSNSDLFVVSRWGFNRTCNHDFDRDYQHLLKIKDILKNYIKTKKLEIKEDEVYLRDFFSKMMFSCWTFIEAGIGYKILDIIETCLECDLLIYDKVLPDDFFKDKESSLLTPRKRLSLLLCKSFIHYQTQDIKAYKDTLHQIINLHPIYNRDRNIFYPIGLNRITESALSLYKVEPTEENKQRVLDLYLAKMYPQIPGDYFEYSRERGLVTFQIAKTFGYAK